MANQHTKTCTDKEKSIYSDRRICQVRHRPGVTATNQRSTKLSDRGRGRGCGSSRRATCSCHSALLSGQVTSKERSESWRHRNQTQATRGGAGDCLLLRAIFVWICVTSPCAYSCVDKFFEILIFGLTRSKKARSPRNERRQILKCATIESSSIYIKKNYYELWSAAFGELDVCAKIRYCFDNVLY